MTPGWLVAIALVLAALAPREASPHTLPGFPHVRLSRVEPGVVVALLSGAPAAPAQPASPTPLRNLVDEGSVAYCRGECTLTMANGGRHTYAEFNLRFKTDGSRLGPEAGKPALLPAGMRGDRAQVIFAGLEDLKRFLVAQC